MSPSATPEWVKPTAREVNDLHWLAERMYADTSRHFFGGIAATLGWIHGDREAPVTERTEQPVTESLAQAEGWAAYLHAGKVPAGAEVSLRGLCDRWAVAYWPVKVTDPRWAAGVCDTLGWLRQTQGQTSPLVLPTRKPDGTVPTVDELVEAEIAANPHRDWRRLPELRVEARRRAADVHALSRSLVALIDETQARLVG